eukprot:scaffold3753_cov98-Skeletonema_dohrnii-CCMP3373.AAC.10
MLASTTLLALLLLANVLSTTSSAQDNVSHRTTNNQIYLDVHPVNTTSFLESLRKLPLSSFRLTNDKDRTRVGIIGQDLAQIIPDAVSILPDQTLPTAKKKKGEAAQTTSTTLRNFPSVNDGLVFMYSVGATQELAKLMDRLLNDSDDQMLRISSIFSEINHFEQLLALTTGENSTLRMKEAASKAAIIKNEMELELLRAKHELERAEMTRVSEEEQLRKSEEMTLARIKREDEAARLQAERAMLAKFEASQRIEKAKIQAAEAVAAIENEKRILFHKASEEMKVKTARAVAIAKAEADRANEDIHLRRLKAESEQRRKRNIAAINAVFTHVSSSLSNAVSKPKEVLTFVGYICLLVSSIFFARETSKLIRSIIESFIGRPQLVRETTRKSLPWSLLAYAKLLVLPWRSKRDTKSIDETFSDLILPLELKTRVVELAHAARNANKHQAPYRHVLLHGPPGTGKTLVAKKLAQVIEIDYALMSGGDVSPLGADAVTQIHSLFAWAKHSQRGVLLFIDEAECFLGSRDTGLMTATAHNALNALLYNTGGDRRDFMLVLATNRAEDLDSAVLDRCDESIFFPLPNAECRGDLISLYFDQHFRQFMETTNLLASTLKAQITQYFTKQKPLLLTVDSDIVDEDEKLKEDVLKQVVKDTEGFSGRAIAKMAIAWQAAVYGTDGAILDKDTFFSTVENHKAGMKQKEEWSQ